jgi:hypothetical protein
MKIASRAIALLTVAVVGAFILAGVFVLGKTAASSPPADAVDRARAERFDRLIQSLNLDSGQKTQADILFEAARQMADADPDVRARPAEYRALLRESLTVLRTRLRTDQQSVLDKTFAREADAEARRVDATRARLDQFLSALKLRPEQSLMTAPILAQAANATDTAGVRGPMLLETGYWQAFAALEPTLSAEQRASIEALVESRRQW